MNDQIEVTAVLPVDNGYEEIARQAEFKCIWFRQAGSYTRRFVFDTFIMPKMARVAAPDAILALGNIGLMNPPAPQGVLIHDAHYVYPKRYHGEMTCLQRMRYAVQMRQVKRCVAHSAVIYCQTMTMLRRVQQLCTQRQNVKLLPNCIPACARGECSPAGVPLEMRRYEGRFRFICLSRYYPHKNIEGIVNAFRVAGSQLRNVVVFLTVAADQHPNARRLLSNINRFGLSDHVVNLGPVKPQEIPAYFKHCHGLLFPTRMESFSVTYLESMAADLPILTSDLDFAREVCGDAALYFDAWSDEAMARAIRQFCDDAALREQLARRGRQQAATAHSQSWEDIAYRVVSDLRDATRKRRL